MGDALTETVAHVLVRIADDPRAPLELVRNPAANEYARGAALQAWTRLAVEAPLPTAVVRELLATLYDRFRPDRESYLAARWCIVAASLGLADLRTQVEHLLASQPSALFPVYSVRDLERQTA